MVELKIHEEHEHLADDIQKFLKEVDFPDGWSGVIQTRKTPIGKYSELKEIKEHIMHKNFSFAITTDNIIHLIDPMVAVVADYVVTDHDWEEHFDHENGFYNNTCNQCGHLFMGHKRMTRCKKCMGC